MGYARHIVCSSRIYYAGSYICLPMILGAPLAPGPKGHMGIMLDIQYAPLGYITLDPILCLPLILSAPLAPGPKGHTVYGYYYSHIVCSYRIYYAGSHIMFTSDTWCSSCSRSQGTYIGIMPYIQYAQLAYIMMDPILCLPLILGAPLAPGPKGYIKILCQTFSMLLQHIFC